jgi:transposase-like protein
MLIGLARGVDDSRPEPRRGCLFIGGNAKPSFCFCFSAARRIELLHAQISTRTGLPDGITHANRRAAEYPEAMKCLATDLEEVLTTLRFPESHRKRIRTTNLLERLFGEGRRRSKVVPRFMSERSGLSLLFALLVDASAGWHGVKIAPALAQQLQALRPHPSTKALPRLAA